MSNQETSHKIVPCSLDDESFVFVSYAHTDSRTVFPIVEGISERGFSVWYDKGISISSTWTDEIATAIMNCKIFVVFITKSSVASSYVRSEIEFALNNKIKMIPVYLDGMEVLPPGLALGLNATQGITDTRDPEKIAALICDVLDYNKVTRRGGAVSHQKGDGTCERGKPGWGSKRFRLSVAAAIIAAIAAAGLLFAQWANRGAYSIELAKANFLPAEPLKVKISGISRPDVLDTAIIGICSADAPHGEYISNAFVQDDAAVMTLRAPLEAGHYEVRGYSSGNELTKATLASSVPFTVSGNAAGAFSIEIDKRQYSPGEDIRTKISGVPKYMIDDGAIIGVYGVEAPHDKFWGNVDIRERDSEFSLLTAPLDAGDYEIRGYASWKVWTDETLVSRVKFTVADEAHERSDSQ
ncbi:MAG: toll/interleukin-1 receptor domain-containing protein [Synergistaceae bacterium]|nr:toll/interleukin-1 receptor domain-containing protein [Synergistaceae bacterium]